MYHLSDSISIVKGVGKATQTDCQAQGIISVKDMLLTLPLRYEDRSQRCTIAAVLQTIPSPDFVTIQATATQIREFYKYGRRITSAIIKDQTGELKVYWFNNRYIQAKLKQDPENFFSGKISAKGLLTQPTVEAVSSNTLHTGRLVPVYSSTLRIKQGSWRRLLKRVVEHLAPLPTNDCLPDITTALKQLHFPDTAETLITARERLALEEMLSLIQASRQLKQVWDQRLAASSITKPLLPIVPASIPFTLTTDQIQATMEIVNDLTNTKPMNRLLVGDVGSGKTVVAALASRQIVLAGQVVTMIAPTQILAQQHHRTLQTLLPDISIKLLTSQTTTKTPLTNQPALWVGTHSLINRFATLKPALVIYDEQHRFGVKHRSPAFQTPDWTSENLQTPQPHLLTMTATPIPRSLMLSMFAHVGLSVLEHLPANRQPITTWLVPESKRPEALQWVQKQLLNHPERPGQALVVCPFIDPSDSEALENIAAANQMYETLKHTYQSEPAMQLALLHSRLKPAEKQHVMAAVFANQVRILVTTPIVEVGVDIPTADVMIIEAAERFGLASLHQLRGRVGRAGQAGFCLLFTNSKQPATLNRLKAFTTQTNGMKLAELDLQNRGAGDIFGVSQHGFGSLRFASWANASLITKAKQLSDQLQTQGQQTWQPIFDNQVPDTRLHNN